MLGYFRALLTGRMLDPEWLTEMFNELDDSDHDGGAGIKRQEAHLPIGRPIGPRASLADQGQDSTTTSLDPAGQDSMTPSLDHGQGSMTPGQQALHVARQRMQIARTTDVELHQAIHKLGMALGASRMEEGTIKALHAVLLHMDRPGMRKKEAYTLMGASQSNFRRWRSKVQDLQDAQPCREKERAPGKRPAPPAEAELFVAESLDIQDTLEKVIVEEQATEMTLPLVWQPLVTPSTAPRALAETEGPTPVQAWKLSYLNDLLQDELGRFSTAEVEAPTTPQLQLTTAQLQLTSAAMPAPPAPTAAPPPSVRHPLRHHHPYPSPSQRHANYSAPPKRPRLLPCPQKPSHPAAPALLRPPRHHARSRAPELLTAAAALRSFVDEMVGLGGAQAA